VKQFFYECTQFLFFLIAMTTLGIVFTLYATWVLLMYIYQRITGDE